jgi:hypothetical protein
MSYHNISNPATNAQRQTVNAQGQSAPAGYHYMPDGTLMSNAVMAPNKVIRNFDLNLSDLPYASEARQFTISGDNGAQFILEIRNEDTYYYNFTTRAFQVAPSRLEKTITNGIYRDSVAFPTVTSGVYSNIAARNDKVTGTVNGNVTAITTVVLDQTIESLGISVGDRVTGNATLDGLIFYVAAIPSANTFTLSAPATISNDTVLSFYGHQYDIYLYAVPGTIHAAYYESRFGDGSLDVNGSSGSNSLVMQKVIYQYATIDLTISGYSPNGTISGVNTNAVISTSRGKSKAKTPFSYVFTAGATSAVRVLKQPSSSDVSAFIEPVVGAAPVTLPGENIYPAVTTAAIDTGGGGTRVNSVSGSIVTMFIAPSLMDGPIKVGDRIHCAARSGFASSIVTVTTTSTSPTMTFEMSQTAASLGLVANDVLSFSNQMNYSWPVTNFADKIKSGMMVVYDGVNNVTADTVVSDYEDTITIFENTEKEQVIVKNKIQAVDTKAQKPTIVKGLVTVQPGDITFNKQQVLALAGDTLKIGGYGESEILRVFGWDVKFTDLKVTLTAPTTTTSGVVTGNAIIGVNNVEGVINNVSRVGGIGINPALQNPLITGGGGATGAGNWTADAVQTLESGITLTIENTSRVAIITGNIEIIKAGTASQILRFDLEKFLSDTA